MNTKLRIDLSQGLLEVEGSETFVKTIYNDFKHHFVPTPPSAETVAEERPKRTRTRKRSTNSPAAAQTEPAGDGSEATSSKTKATRTQTYEIIVDLDLGASKRHPSLVDFMDAKVPITNDERNLVFTYYLQKSLNLSEITPNHIYTCYREAKIRAPINIESSLKTTAKLGWLVVEGDGNRVSLSGEGTTYVEQNLPKRAEHS